MWKSLRDSASLSHFSVFLGGYSCIALEVFPEEGNVRKVQRIGNFLDGQFRRAEFSLGIAYHKTGNDVSKCLSGSLFDGGTEVLGRQMHFFGIEGNISLRMIMLYNDSHQVFYNFLIAVVAGFTVAGFILFIGTSQADDELRVQELHMFGIEHELHVF